jgi:hypothetical protein
MSYVLADASADDTRYVTCVVVFGNVRITPVKIAFAAVVEKLIPVP